MTTAPTMNYGAPPPGARRNSGLAIGSLICGTIALLLAWIPCVNLIAPVLALVALILGIIAWVGASKDPAQKPTLAIVGIVLSVLAIIAFFVSYVVLGAVFERSGAGIIRWGTEQQANAYEGEARSSGVSDSEITAARAEFDAAMESLPEDAQGAQRAAEEALRRFQDRLDAAAGGGDSDGDDPPDSDTPDAGDMGEGEGAAGGGSQ